MGMGRHSIERHPYAINSNDTVSSAHIDMLQISPNPVTEVICLNITPPFFAHSAVRYKHRQDANVQNCDTVLHFLKSFNKHVSLALAEKHETRIQWPHLQGSNTKDMKNIPDFPTYLFPLLIPFNVIETSKHRKLGCNLSCLLGYLHNFLTQKHIDSVRKSFSTMNRWICNSFSSK